MTNILDRTLADLLTPRRKALLVELAALLIIFAIFRAYELTSFTFGLDDERALAQDGSARWILEGRWATYLLESFVLIFPVQPFVPLAVFGLCAVLGYMAFVRSVALTPNSLLALLLFPVFSCFPIWAHLTAYQSNTAPAGLGLLLCCSAGYLFHKSGAPSAAGPLVKSLGRSAVIIVFIATATAFYQSYFVVSAVIFFSIIVVRAFRGATQQEVIRDCLRAACLGLLAAGLYGAGLVISSWASGLTPTYLAHFVPGSQGTSFHYFLTSVAHEGSRVIKGVYLGEASAYGSFSPAYGALFLLAFFGVLWRAWRLAGNRGLLLGAVGVVILMLAPFAVILLADFQMALRTMIAVPLALTTLCVLAYSGAPKGLARAGLLSLCLVHLTIFNNLGAYNTTRDLVQKHDLIMASALTERIAMVAGALEATPSLEVFGAKAFDAPYERAPTSSIGVSFFELLGGNSGVVVGYLKMIGAPSFGLIDPALRPQLVATFLSMPVWPAPGSVILGPENIVLVRLSKEPNPAYRDLVGAD